MDDEQKIRHYAPMLYKLGMLYLGNRQDTEDCMQDALCKLLYNAPAFNDNEHEKAWLAIHSNADESLCHVCRL